MKNNKQERKKDRDENRQQTNKNAYLGDDKAGGRKMWNKEMQRKKDNLLSSMFASLSGSNIY